MSKKISIFIILCFLFFVGCEKVKPKPENIEPTSAKTPIKGALLAQVNDWAIGTTDFKDKLDALKTLLPQKEFADQFDDAETKKKILEELVNFEILAQVAESRGLDKEQDVTDAVKNFKRNFLAQKMLGKLYNDVTVTNIEIENFYDTNKGLFREPEERRVKEIVVASEAQAKDILIRLLQGEDFGFIAKSYSLADSRDKNGDLGLLKIDQETTTKQKFPNFWKAVVTTEQGKYSSYFTTPEGRYCIIKVEEIKGGEVKALKDVRDNIKEHLRGVQANVKKDEIIAEAKKKFKVIINSDLLK
jgi:peptidyl-prolyl cis-trans isomerase C